MPDSEKTAMLLDDLAALDPAQRRKVAKEVRKVAASPCAAQRTVRTPPEG
jgi:hypothetical protein